MCYRHRCCRRRGRGRRRVSDLSSSSQFDAGLSVFVSCILSFLFHSCPTPFAATLLPFYMRIAIAIVSIAEIADGRACKHDFNLDCKMNTPSVVPIILLYFVFGATSIYSIRL